MQARQGAGRQGERMMSDQTLALHSVGDLLLPWPPYLPSPYVPSYVNTEIHPPSHLRHLSLSSLPQPSLVESTTQVWSAACLYTNFPPCWCWCALSRFHNQRGSSCPLRSSDRHSEQRVCGGVLSASTYTVSAKASTHAIRLPRFC